MIAYLQIHWVPVLAVAGLLTAALGVVWLWCLARRCWRGTSAVGRDVGLGVLEKTQETPRRRHAPGRLPGRQPVVPVRHSEPPHPVLMVRTTTTYRTNQRGNL